MQRKIGLYFLASVIALMFILLIASYNFRYLEAKLIPMAVAGITLILACVEVFRERNKQQKKNSDQDIPFEFKEVNKKSLFEVAWVMGLLFAVYLFGFLLAIPAFILFYLKAHQKPWKVSIIVSIVTTAILYGSFQYLLQADLYQGILLEKYFGF
jgi:4-amino-4-deoxy-L-arabinose transferase-like glycosyltransferase